MSAAASEAKTKKDFTRLVNFNPALRQAIEIRLLPNKDFPLVPLERGSTLGVTVWSGT